MDLENIIILAIIIILAFLVIRFVTKILAKVIAFLIVIAVVFYALFYWDGGILSLGNEDFMLYELREKFCEDEKDQTKCNCLIEPLIEDVESKYSPEEIQKIKKNKIKSINIITSSLRSQREEIRQCFRENSEGKTLDESLEEVKNKMLRERLKDLLEEDDNSEESEPSDNT